MNVKSFVSLTRPGVLALALAAGCLLPGPSRADATPAEMTIPSTIGDEKATNPFMRSPDAGELGRRRSLKDNF